MGALENLISNFSLSKLDQFFRNEIPSFRPDEVNFSFLFEDNDTIQNSFTNINKLGEADLSNGEDLFVFTAQTKFSLIDRSSKKQQYDIAKKLLKEEVKDAAFFIFYDDNGQFRFSFIRADFKGTKRDYTTFKRYTYFVSPRQTNQTFIRQLSACNFQDLEEIQAAFSVEPLNKEFYQKIAKAFYQLIGGKVSEGSKAKEYKASLKLPSLDPEKNHRTFQEFAVRFIGRTIFIWFLKNKTSDAGVPLIPTDWLSSVKVKSTKHYYHNLLEKLFFEILNTPIKDRIDSLPDEHATIPFLNGGLFEPQYDDFYEAGFKGFSKYHTTLDIPDSWIHDLFETLEQFNFTIDENTLTDMEVSIDPEMLGTIFENLLAEIDPDTEKSARKSTGSFYTPREIVDYMVVESLVAYLGTRTELGSESLRSLFIDGELDEELEDHKGQLMDAFDEVKILDPACGSGAFPMGALHKINLALQKLDPDAAVWKEKQLAKIENVAYRNALKDKLDKSNVDYVRKIGIIQHSIYGVDIQPIATEISKLRSFLSLVVDENIDDAAQNRGIYPLPNLEFKFVTANTLIGLKENTVKSNTQSGAGLDFSGVGKDIENLQQTRDQYLQSFGSDKEKLKEKFLQIQQQIAQKEFSTSSFGSNKVAQQIIGWNPFSHEKSNWFDPKWMFGLDVLDIVIGNPPYIQLQKTAPGSKSQKLADLYSDEEYETFTRTGDIYTLFFERGVNYLSSDGLLCFITSNKWMRAGYGEYLRNYFVKRTTPVFLIDFSAFQVFKSASVDSAIMGVSRARATPSPNKRLVACTIGSDFGLQTSLQDYFDTKCITLEELSQKAWIIRSKPERELIEKIEDICISLNEWDLSINRGILTGLNEAFIINTRKKEELISVDKKSAEVIEPLIRGRDIVRYNYKHDGLWLINTHNGFRDDKGNSFQRINIAQFPAIKSHLDKYNPKLKSRADQGSTPYNLRNCAYLAEFSGEKIVYAETMRVHRNGSRFPRFGYADDHIITDKTCFIMKGNHIKYILGILNSKMGNYLVHQYVTKLDSGGFNMQKIHIDTVPIPPYSNSFSCSIDRIASKILEGVKKGKDVSQEEVELDLAVFKQYQLSFEEVGYIDPNTPFSAEEFNRYSVHE